MRARTAVAAAVLAAWALAAPAATLKFTLVMRADDERLDPKRVELAYPGQPGGALSAAIEVALGEAEFELDAAKLKVEFDTVEVESAEAAKAELVKLEKAGAAAAVLDLPGPWVAAAAPAVKMPLLNAGSADDALRGASCQPNLWHTALAERMRADAVAQALVARKWMRVLVLAGLSDDDAARLAVVSASLKRFGLKTVATKPYKLSADPRERDLGNPLLLTGGLDYDAVWIVDTDGEFARALPYRTALPRPVVGDAGLLALGWVPTFERFGAPQLSRRFTRHAKRPMTGPDWAGWAAAKALIQAALESPNAPSAAQVQKALGRDSFVLDGFKGSRTSFRGWDHQLRQSVLLSDGLGVIGLAPVDGMLHPKNVLDTLGADAPEALCKAIR